MMNSDQSHHPHTTTMEDVPIPSRLKRQRESPLPPTFVIKCRSAEERADTARGEAIKDQQTLCPNFIALDGRSVPLFDSVVMGLAGQIESIFDDCGTDFEKSRAILEVEGRIGVLKDHDRLRLPVGSEVVLCPPGSSWRYKFESGVSAFQFKRIRTALQEKLGVLTPDAHTPPRTQPNQPVFLRTIDDIYNVSETFFEELDIPKRDGIVDDVFEPRPVRVSYQGETRSGAPHEVIHKDRKVTVNIYTGRDKDEAVDNLEEKRSVDIRIAVNVEYKINLSIPPKSVKLTTRKRERVSYPVRGMYRIDTTMVDTVFSGSGKSGGDMMRSNTTTAYEIEIEINPIKLKEEVNKKKAGLPHHLFHIIKDFLGLLRGLAAFLNSSRSPITTNNSVVSIMSQSDTATPIGSAPPPQSGGISTSDRRQVNRRIIKFADLTDCRHNDEVIDLYLKFVSPVVPLVGDYLFRAVAPQLSAANVPVLSDMDILESTKSELTPDELQILKSKVNL